MACFGGTPRACRRRRGAKREIGRCPSRRRKPSARSGTSRATPLRQRTRTSRPGTSQGSLIANLVVVPDPGAPRRPVPRTDRSRGRPHRRPRPSVPPTSTAPPPLPAGRIRYTGRPKTYMVYRYTGCAGGRAGPQSQAAVFHPRRLVLGPSTSRWSQNPCCVVRQPAGPRGRAGRVLVSLSVDPSRSGDRPGRGALAVTRRTLSRTKPNILGEGDAVPGT